MQGMSLKKSERACVDALMDLARTKSVARIQCSELCRTANISRATFYKHYVDMPSFIDAVTDRFVDAMRASIEGGNLFVNMLTGDGSHTLQTCTDFMDEHRAFLRTMIGRNGTINFQHRITDMWEELLKAAIVQEMPHLGNPDSLAILARYVARGFWGVLELQTFDDSNTPASFYAEQLRYYLCDCTLGSLRVDGR